MSNMKNHFCSWVITNVNVVYLAAELSKKFHEDVALCETRH